MISLAVSAISYPFETVFRCPRSGGGKRSAGCVSGGFRQREIIPSGGVERTPDSHGESIGYGESMAPRPSFPRKRESSDFHGRGGNPSKRRRHWIPAFAGMTEKGWISPRRSPASASRPAAPPRPFR